MPYKGSSSDQEANGLIGITVPTSPETYASDKKCVNFFTYMWVGYKEYTDAAEYGKQ